MLYPGRFILVESVYSHSLEINEGKLYKLGAESLMCAILFRKDHLWASFLIPVGTHNSFVELHPQWSRTQKAYMSRI